MKFGYFDDSAKEYVITTPDTPLPWINYLGSQDFFSLISNTCGGYSFYKDAKLLRITRYRYNNIPVDSNGKYYYIHDGEEIWNPGSMPSKTPLDSYECHHGIGYSRFLSSKNGLKANLLAFVPVNSTCEINKLTLTNTTDTSKTFSLFSYVEFCLWNAVDDSTNFQRNLSIGEVELEGSTIYHKTEYRERRRHYSFFSVNSPVDGFDTSRDVFLGMNNGNAFPAAVKENKVMRSATVFPALSCAISPPVSSSSNPLRTVPLPGSPSRSGVSARRRSRAARRCSARTASPACSSAPGCSRNCRVSADSATTEWPRSRRSAARRPGRWSATSG